MGLVDKLFGNKSEKEIKRIEKYVDAIEALDEKMQALSDEVQRHRNLKTVWQQAKHSMTF